jgi:predicted metal-dependent hydrolase
VSRTTPAFHQLWIVVGAVTKVAPTGGPLVVAAPVGSAAAVRKAVVTWYRHHAAERLPERAAIWARKMGVTVPVVLIRDQRRRWGSCDPKGNLRFNWRIVQAPMRLVDYVVAHELVHLAHRNHTAAFWAALGRVMPDYEARREALRGMGARLEW